MTQSELIDLEQKGWQALSSSGAAAAEFYERVLDGEVIMLLPGGMVLDAPAAVVRSMSGQPWSSYGLEDLRYSDPPRTRESSPMAWLLNAKALRTIRP